MSTDIGLPADTIEKQIKVKALESCYTYSIKNKLEHARGKVSTTNNT